MMRDYDSNKAETSEESIQYYSVEQYGLLYLLYNYTIQLPIT